MIRQGSATASSRATLIRLPRQVMLPASGCFINPVMVGNRCSSGDYRAGFSCRTGGTPKLRSDKFATIDDTLFPFDLPIVARKKVSAAFGGRITTDGGVMLLAQAERRLGIAGQLARVIPDERHASRVTHLLSDILRARIFAIACGMKTPMTWTGYGLIRRSLTQRATRARRSGSLVTGWRHE
jgi:hypothetical protein